MGVKDFEKEKVIAPFLGFPLQFIPGLDPLGLLNIGERTFDKLLPGLNNVTGRIRYYSFYCWFFDLYSKEVGLLSAQEQFKFLRRAEYLLALLAARNKWPGIPGISRAEILYRENQEEEFALQEGTGEDKKTTEGSYWKNPRGVFGQNYVSPLAIMGLVRERSEGSGIYIRTDFNVDGRVSGLQLAQAFHENIGEDFAALFTKAIIRSRITRDELDRLSEPFNMHKIPDPSSEQTFLINLLTGPDDPTITISTFHRKRTIQIILDKIVKQSNPLSALDFVMDAYFCKGKINGIQDETFMLWYYYQLEQFWHVVATGSLQAFLRFLNAETGGSWINESRIIGDLTSLVTQLKAESSLLPVPDTDNPIENRGENERTLAKNVHSNDPVVQVSSAIFLLKKLINENEAMIPELKRLARQHDLHSQGSFVNCIEDLKRHLDEGSVTFINYFLRNYVVLRHQWVALKKMNDSQSTEKFLREDGYIRYLSPIDFGYSSPRLDTVLSFLEDLGIITENRTKVSELGMNIVNE